MTIDNLLAAEMVTADGALVSATTDEHLDLFWALRGGGGNFGIATHLRFRLHPVDTVVGGAVVYRLTPAVLRDFADVALAAPDDLATFGVVLKAPPLPFIPEGAHGAHVIMMATCFAGDRAASEPVLAPLRTLGGDDPLADTVAPLPYPALLDLAKMTEVSRPQAIRAGFLDSLGNDTIETVIRSVERATSPYSSVMIRGLGGQMARVPEDATAFSHRDAAVYLAIGNAWDEGDPQPERHMNWTEQLWRAVAPRVCGAYVNYLGNEGEDRVRAAYSPATIARLAAIKRRYDPDNVFHLNANIPPA
jgi:FAD/FMN-containing dehydrogenase